MALPMLDGRFITLTGPFDGLLTTPTEALEEAPHVVRVIMNAEVSFGDRRHAPTGPHLAGVAALRRAGQQYSSELLSLLGCEANWSARDRFSLQALLAMLLECFLPGVDRATGTADLL